MKLILTIKKLIRFLICKRIACDYNDKEMTCNRCGKWQWFCYFKCDVCKKIIIPKIHDGWLAHNGCEFGEIIK